jgi:general secretion pathway protein D
VVKADPQLMREIEAAIQQLDIRRQQVLIEAAIIEVSGNDADQLGIQWALGDLSSGVGLMSFSNVGASLASIAAGYASAGASGAAAAIAGDASKGNGATFGVGNFENSRKAYGALIQALKTNTKSNFLSTPSIVTMDNEEAYIVVGQNVPFVTGSVSTGTSGTVNPYTTVERKDVGVTLKVVPHIGENGTVRLEVEQEVSDVQNNKGQATDLVTNKRAIKTAVLAEHGQTVVLGGLIADNTALSRQGVPGLSDIPYLGRLFRADSRSNEKRNLLVFIHPTIVGDADDVRRLSQQRYNQLYSLQLAMDNNGNFAKLPENVGDIYQQQPTLNSSSYQKVPTAIQSKTVVVTTPVAVDAPPVQRQSIQLPAKATERSKNTVTTTTIRPAYSQ